MKRNPEVFDNYVTGEGGEEREEEEGEEEGEVEGKGKGKGKGKEGGKKEPWEVWEGHPEMSTYRCTVERAISAIKRWRILSNEGAISRMGVEYFTNILQIVVALTNWQMNRNKTTRW